MMSRDRLETDVRMPVPMESNPLEDAHLQGADCYALSNEDTGTHYIARETESRIPMQTYLGAVLTQGRDKI
eukprot:4728049-Amphidinium_carterae.1